MAKSGAMKLLALNVSAILFAVLLSSSAVAQPFARTPAPSTDAAKLDLLAKKIDEQNAKIDTLSQQILKLEQQIASMRPADARPGVMIGEGAPATAPTTPPATSSTIVSASPSPTPANGSTHVVARGETLTSIAKQHKVPVDELQRHNHIENPLKLQVGQTLAIPGAPAASPSPPP